MDKKTLNKILAETETGYDLVSEKFSQTRKHFWRGLEFITDYAKENDRILDFGCGNGRLLELFRDKKINYTGVDVSQKLLDFGKNRYNLEKVSFLKIEPSQVTLPFPDNFFNASYSIAVFHHFPKAHAEIMAKELHRITAPGGHVVITVWNLWSKRYLKNIIRNWILKIIGRSRLDWNDCFIRFKTNEGKIFQRYHHAWRGNELRSIFQNAGLEIASVEKNGNNIVLTAKRAE